MCNGKRRRNRCANTNTLSSIKQVAVEPFHRCGWYTYIAQFAELWWSMYDDQCMQCVHVLKCTCIFVLKVAPHSFLQSGKHIFQTQNHVHWYFVTRMKQTVWYRTAFWKSETATKKCVTAVAMATKTFQNDC